MTEFSFDLNCRFVCPGKKKKRKKKTVGFISFPLRLRTEIQLTRTEFIFPKVLCLTILVRSIEDANKHDGYCL